jgi:hypothetical protein
MRKPGSSSKVTDALSPLEIRAIGRRPVPTPSSQSEGVGVVRVAVLNVSSSIVSALN